MPTNGPKGIQIEISGDATPLERDIAEAKAKVEASQATSNLDARKGAIKQEIDQTTESFLKMQGAAKETGTVTEKVVGPTSNTATGLKSLNKTLSDTVGQVQAVFAKLTMVVGVATGFYALGKAIRESVVDALESGAEKAKKFNESLSSTKTVDNLNAVSKKIEEVQGQIAQAIEEAETAMDANLPLSAVMKQNLVNQLEEELKSLRAEAKILQSDANAAEQRAKRDKEREAAASNLKDLAALRAAAMREAMDEETRIVAEAAEKRAAIIAKYNAASEAERRTQLEATMAAIEAINSVESSRLDAIAAKRQEEANREAERRKKDAEDRQRERDKQDDDLRQWVEKNERQAENVRRAWESSFRAVREASNAAFNTDSARSMVELAGNLNQTAVTATANMNRIIVGGTD